MSKASLITLEVEEAQWIGLTSDRIIRHFNEIAQKECTKVFDKTDYKNTELRDKR